MMCVNVRSYNYKNEDDDEFYFFTVYDLFSAHAPNVHKHQHTSSNPPTISVFSLKKPSITQITSSEGKV